MQYRDEHGRQLDDYPRPSVAVDTAVLTVVADREPALSVLLVRRESGHRSGQWQLPGTFLHPGERLADAALRALRDKAGITGLQPRQLHVLDEPQRDDRGWVLSAAHLDVVPAQRLTSEVVHLVPVTQATGLAFDHDAIVAMAVAALRDEYRDRPDPRRLLEGAFTVRDLHRLHSAIDPDVSRRSIDTFRRRMVPQLRPAGSTSVGVVGKPAALYRHRG